MNDVDWETACISAGGFSWGDLSRERWPRIRTNNFMEQPHQKSCRRFRVIGRFPANNSAMMLVCARLHHVADIQFSFFPTVSTKYPLHQKFRFLYLYFRFACLSKIINTLLLLSVPTNCAIPMYGGILTRR